MERIRIGVWKNSWEAVDTVFGSSDEHLNEDSAKGQVGTEGRQTSRLEGPVGGEGEREMTLERTLKGRVLPHIPCCLDVE